MKFIHSPIEDYYDESKKTTVLAYVEDCLAEDWLKLCKLQQPPEVMDGLIAETVEYMWIDGGGAVVQGEARSIVKVNGEEFRFFSRHAEDILDALSSSHGGKDSREHLKNATFFRGCWHSYLISQETRLALIRELGAMIAVTHTDSKDAAAKVADAIDGANDAMKEMS